MKKYVGLFIVSVVLILLFVLSCGCTDQEDAGQQLTNTSVSVEEAWGQAAVALLEQYAIFQPGWEIFESFNGTIVSKDPAMLYDSEGGLLYYRFPVIAADGENYLNYSIQVSADKRIGKTVTNIGTFILDGEIICLNSSREGAVSGETRFVCGTPLPEYHTEPVQDYQISFESMMIGFWRADDFYSRSVLYDLDDAGVDISKPIPVEDQETVRNILIENIEERENGTRVVHDGEYEADWNT